MGNFGFIIGGLLLMIFIKIILKEKILILILYLIGLFWENVFGVV